MKRVQTDTRAITSFFPKVPKPDAPAEETPGRWLPEKPEHRNRFHQTLGADLRADCNICKSRGKATTQHAIALFRPDDLIAPREAAQFDKAHAAYLRSKGSKDAVAFVERCRGVHGLAIEGLMCIPPADENPGPHFALLEKLARQAGVEKLSMGMSGDYELAVAFGATSVRVGSAIFGTR